MNNKIKDLIGALASILIISSIIFLAGEIKTRFSSSFDLSKTRSIAMSAEGKVTTKPDTATISFSVVTQGKEAAKVQEDNDKKMKTVIDFLKNQSIKDEDIKTSNYNLYPQYDYNIRTLDGSAVPPTIVGYTLNQSVSVKVRDLNKVGVLVGGLTSKGVNQIDNVTYFIDDPDTLKAEARKQAVDKAKQKANELAGRLGVRLGRVINFSENEISFPQPYFEKALPLASGGGGAAPVEPGSQDTTVNVTLTFELK